MEKPKAILIDVIDPRTEEKKAAKRLEELKNLTNTFGGMSVVEIIQKKDVPDYETYIGKGKVEEICELAAEQKAEILIINNILKPRQIFELNEIFRKKKLDTKVWDRVDLILKIFDKHAQSTEAKLQIELAGIRHMGPRIFGMGIELSRQAGAMGLRAGQGESNIEMMKRHLQAQELNIQKKLKHYETINEGHRQRRRRRNFKTVAIVGYTNAGKSSLLNAMTGKGAYVANELFATLDTRVGKLYIPQEQDEIGKFKKGTEILMSDTIGFIQDLPPFLIQAFKSTLSETVEADLILHVIDISDPEMHEKIEVVEDILKQLGLSDKPKVYGFNKIDLIAPRGIFEGGIKAKRHGKGIVEAGEGASELLGWTERKSKEAIKKMKELEKKYAKYSPVFFSAAEKLNLKEVEERIKSVLIGGPGRI